MNSCLLGLLLALVAAYGQRQSTKTREHFDHATVHYDWVFNGRGERLRTFITQPNGAPSKVPVLFVVGWLSCDSVEYPDGSTRDGFGILLRQLIERSGYATVRMDKPGVGESEGVCARADFQSEMEGYQAAFELMPKYPFLDLSRVFVLGLSNGGGFSPMAVSHHPVRGFISCGSWGRTWYEHMVDLERRQGMQSADAPSEVTDRVKNLLSFYRLFLMEGMIPGEVITKHPEWRYLWRDSPDGQYGRPAKFYQQLQALNLGQMWQQVTAPVLVLRGTSDRIMSRTDSEAIAETVNKVHPYHARYKEIEGMTHDFLVNGKFADEILQTILDWTKEQLASE
jgi:pimeloyl-ACP methyl ester carboxylesterase